MPPKEKKKFKAVTEEVKQTPEPEAEVKEPVLLVEETKLPIQKTVKEDLKNQKQAAKLIEKVVVTETDNITPSSKKSVSRKDTFLFVGIMFLVAFVVVMLAGGVYVYLNGVKNLPSGYNQQEAPLPTSAGVETSLPSPISSPSATTKRDYSLFNVSVLNGSGAIGAATAVRDLLQKGGFKVGYVGNAQNFNFTDTIIQVKSTVSADVVAAARSLLAPEYSIKIGDQLDSQQRFDIIVTVGSK